MGTGQLLVWDRGILILPESDVAWRFLTAYIFAAWSMLTVASIAFFFSSFVENAIGPIVATMGVLIVFLIVSVMPLEAFQSVRPYLFTSYIDIWQKIFADPVPWAQIREGVAWLGAYSAVMVLGAWLIFVRKDILS